MGVLVQRLRRSARLGLLAGDFAFVRRRKAGPDRDTARRRLVDRLGLLHGLPQKIGQLLAFSEIESADPAFSRLTENEPSLSAAEARAEVGRQLGAPVERLFASFHPRGIAASIGQVHRATLHDGRKVAVKIQYPDIADAVDFDLRALGWLTAPVGDLRRGFDLKAYRQEIGSSLRAELDYRREADSLRRFAGRARGLTRPIALPAPVPEFCGERILTTTWLDGESLAAARTWPRAEREELSASLVELFWTGLLEWDFLHADPHPGNYRFVRGDGRPMVGLLDFGCVKRVPTPIQNGLRGLLADALAKTTTTESCRAHFAMMGFNSAALDLLGDRLTSIASALTAPFSTEGKFDSAQWRLGDRLGEVLGPDRMAFRTAGPPELIFILRAFQGLLHYLTILDAPVDWIAATGLTVAIAPEPGHVPVVSTGTESESLHIRVEENGVVRVALTFAAAATEHLYDLVPPELHGRLREKAIDLAEIAAGARRRHYAAGELFSLQEAGRSVRVWLA